MTPWRSSFQPGFVLLDTLIAVALLIVTAVGVVPLFAISVAETRAARHRTIASALASARLEQLRSLAWDYVPGPPGTSALPRSDWVSDLAVEPSTASGVGLLQSPPGTLDTDTRGYVDYLEASGRWIAAGDRPPPGAAYIRRWAVRPLPANPADALILQVLVTSIAHERRRMSPRRIWTGEDVLLTTVRARTGR